MRRDREVSCCRYRLPIREPRTELTAKAEMLDVALEALAQIAGIESEFLQLVAILARGHLRQACAHVLSRRLRHLQIEVPVEGFDLADRIARELRIIEMEHAAMAD